MLQGGDPEDVPLQHRWSRRPVKRNRSEWPHWGRQKDLSPRRKDAKERQARQRTGRTKKSVRALRTAHALAFYLSSSSLRSLAPWREVFCLPVVFFSLCPLCLGGSLFHITRSSA